MFSFFITNKALFGSYPVQDVVTDYEENQGIVLFINLTQDNEKNLTTYQTKNAKIWRYRITDQKHPSCIYKYCNFITKISDFIDGLKENEKIYIHCRGGHGRSGLVVASLLIYRNKCTIEEGIKLTNEYHRQRKGLSEKWHKIKIPNNTQINYLYKIFNPIIILNRPFIYKTTIPSFLHKTLIYLENEPTHYNSGAIAFYSLKDLGDIDYITSLNSAKTFHTFMKVVSSKEWNKEITFQDKVNRIVKIIDFFCSSQDFNDFHSISSLTEIYCDLFSYEFPYCTNVFGNCYKIVLLKYHNYLISKSVLVVENNSIFYD